MALARVDKNKEVEKEQSLVMRPKLFIFCEVGIVTIFQW